MIVAKKLEGISSVAASDGRHAILGLHHSKNTDDVTHVAIDYSEAANLASYLLKIGDTLKASRGDTTSTVFQADGAEICFHERGYMIGLLLPGGTTVRFSLERDILPSLLEQARRHVAIDPRAGNAGSVQ